MSTLVIDGHPDAASLTAAIAQRYAHGHGDARILALRDLDFDPHLRFGYRARIPIEPDLAEARRALHDADRIVVVTPVWWGSVPALLKGFFDRALLPQQEYRITDAGLPEGLLAGRPGRLLLTADTPPWAVPLTGLPAVTQVARNTMRLCGIRPVRVTRMLGVKTASDEKVARWLARLEQLGRVDAARQTSDSPSEYQNAE